MRILTLCLAVLLAVGSASELCRGWSADAADRAACCARMERHCATWSADDCCAQSDQRQTREQVRSLPQLEPDMTAGALVVPMLPAIGVDPAPPSPGVRHRPHLLHSVFLI